MKFSIGDPVYVKSNNEEGVIQEFIGQDMASVKVNRKVYHAYLEDLEHPYLRWFTQKKVVKSSVKEIERLLPEKKDGRKKALPQGIYLVFMPIFVFDELDDVVEKVKVYLYNETMHDVNFSYVCKSKNEIVFDIDSVLKAEGEFYLHDVSFEVASQSPTFHYHFTDYLNPKYDLEDVFSLKPKRFFDKIHEIKYQNKAFFYFLLCEKLNERPKIEVVKPDFKSIKMEDSSQVHFDFSQALKKSTYEIDLHIEKLYPNCSTLGASEIIHIQLRECQKALELAIATHQSSLVIIHGLGKGTLKEEIFKLLNQTKWVKRYVNQYDSRYGYGATEVFFHY